MPRFGSKIVMNDFHLTLLTRQSAKHLGVPIWLQPEKMVLAQQIQIILVLCHHKGIFIQKFHKLLKQFLLPELFAVNHSRIEIFVAVQTQHLLHIIPEESLLDDHLIPYHPGIALTQMVVEQFRNIPTDNHVAVQIDGFLIFRKHIRNIKSVIGCAGIIIPNRQLYRCIFDVFIHLHEADFKIIIRQVIGKFFSFLRHASAQNVHMVTVLSRRIFY